MLEPSAKPEAPEAEKFSNNSLIKLLTILNSDNIRLSAIKGQLIERSSRGESEARQE
jgi:hypothetical protein